MKADDFNAVLRSHTTVLGFLAHVDSGKTTLSEAVLYTAGAIRKLGRVDHGSAFLDNNAVEQERGITVFSKEARFAWRDKSYVLLDTPGHVDFSAEAERTLAVLDYALLIVSGADGVQSHTVTLWKLLAAYEIPTFVFVNKMDQPGTDRKRLLADLAARLGESGFVEFSGAAPYRQKKRPPAMRICWKLICQARSLLTKCWRALSPAQALSCLLRLGSQADRNHGASGYAVALHHSASICG